MSFAGRVDSLDSGAGRADPFRCDESLSRQRRPRRDTFPRVVVGCPEGRVTTPVAAGLVKRDAANGGHRRTQRGCADGSRLRSPGAGATETVSLLIGR